MNEKDDFIVAAENELLNFSQPDRTTEEEHVKAMYKNNLKIGSIYPEGRLKGLYIGGIHMNVWQKVRNYYAKNGHEDPGSLARHTSSTGSIVPRNDRRSNMNTGKNRGCLNILSMYGS